VLSGIALNVLKAAACTGKASPVTIKLLRKETNGAGFFSARKSIASARRSADNFVLEATSLA
jgi:hypothetical protein